MSLVTEELIVKVEKKVLNRMKIKTKPTSPIKRSSSSYDNVQRPICSIEELSAKNIVSKNVYTDFQSVPFCKNVSSSPSTEKLLERPGSYKPFWMKMSKSEQNVDNLQQVYNDFDQTYLKMIAANKSQSFRAGNAWMNESDLVARRSSVLKEGNMQGSNISGYRSTNLFNNMTFGGSEYGTKNTLSSKRMGFYKVVPMYTQSAGNVKNKFRDIVSNKVDIQLEPGKFPPIFRTDGQRVFRVRSFSIRHVLCLFSKKLYDRD